MPYFLTTVQRRLWAKRYGSLCFYSKIRRISIYVLGTNRNGPLIALREQKAFEPLRTNMFAFQWSRFLASFAFGRMFLFKQQTDCL